MSLEQIVKVQITRDTQVPTRAGFGTQIFWCYHQNFPELCRVFGDPSELLDLGFTTSSPAYQAMTAAWSQSPRAGLFAVGRRTLPFSMAVRLTPQSFEDGKRYAFQAVSPGGVITEIDYTVPSGADLDDVCDALISQLDAVAGVSASGAVQVVTLTPTDTTLGFEYEFTIRVDDVITTITHTNGGSETATTICDAFRTQINAITGTTVVASGTSTCVITGAAGKSFLLGTLQDEITAVDSSAASTSVLLTADVPGTVFDLRGMPHRSLLELDVETADPGVAADFAELLSEDPSRWYMITADHLSQAQVEALAPLVEAQDKMLLAGLSDSELWDGAEDEDTASELQSAAYSQTPIFGLMNRVSGYHASALAGRCLPYTPGEETWALKTLVGVQPDSLTTGDVLAAIGDSENLPGKKFTIYTRQAGQNVTRNGHVPDGDYIDTIRGVHALKARIAEDVFAQLIRLPKVPFTDSGIQLIAGVVRNTIQGFVTRGFIAASPPFVVTVPLAADVDPSAKANRLLPDIVFTATLAGAIHSVKVQGTVSL